MQYGERQQPMRGQKMPASLRLTKDEQEALRKKSVEINKLLIQKGKEPVKDSELAHKLLELSISYVNVNLSGELYLEI